MDVKLFQKVVENFHELQIEILYRERVYTAVDYDINEVLFALEPVIPVNPDIDNIFWVRAENCRLLHFDE